MAKKPKNQQPHNSELDEEDFARNEEDVVDDGAGGDDRQEDPVRQEARRKEFDDGADDVVDDDDGTDDDDDGDEVDEETERRARKLGWVPQDEWRGKPGAWRPAEEFLQRAEANKAIFDERFGEMERRHSEEIGGISAKLDEAQNVIQKLFKLNKTTREREYRRAKADLEAEKKRAVRESDEQLYDEATKGIEDLDEAYQDLEDDPDTGGDEQDRRGAGDDRGQQRQEQRTDAGGERRPHPDLVAWKDENEWYDKDPELQNYANSMDDFISKTKPGLSTRERLDAVTAEVKRRYPDKFGNPRRRAPRTVHSSNGAAAGGDGAGRKRRRTFNDLPEADRAEAREAFAMFKRHNPDYTEADYLRDYELE